jgi:hypothetical protein
VAVTACAPFVWSENDPSRSPCWNVVAPELRTEIPGV